MQRIHTTVARSLSELDHLAPLWEELLVRQPHTVFQRFSWNRLAAEIFHDRMMPYVICVEGESGAAIIPAAIHHSTGQLELMGETLFDYRDILHGGDPIFLHRAWEQLAACGRPLCVAAIRETAAPARWAEFPLQPFANAPGVSRQIADAEHFRRAHPRAGRQLRKLEKAGVRLTVYSGEDSALMRHIYQRKAEFGPNGNNVFCDPRRQQAMVAIAAVEGKACQVFTLEVDANLIAALVTFLDQNVRRFYTIYFDPIWARYSPGVVLVYEATARSLADGLDCDYMTGEYPYKLRFANSSRSLYKVDVDSKQIRDIASGGLARRVA